MPGPKSLAQLGRAAGGVMGSLLTPLTALRGRQRSRCGAALGLSTRLPTHDARLPSPDPDPGPGPGRPRCAIVERRNPHSPGGTRSRDSDPPNSCSASAGQRPDSGGGGGNRTRENRREPAGAPWLRAQPVGSGGMDRVRLGSAVDAVHGGADGTLRLDPSAGEGTGRKRKRLRRWPDPRPHGGRRACQRLRRQERRSRR